MAQGKKNMLKRREGILKSCKTRQIKNISFVTLPKKFLHLQKPHFRWIVGARVAIERGIPGTM